MSGSIQLAAEGVGWDTAGCTILSGIDLQVADGECIAVVGPNGAGKTTLLRLLAGLLKPSRGRLESQGRPYESISRRELAIALAYVPQSRPLRVPLTVEDLVMLGRYPYLSPLRLAPRESDFEAVSRALIVAGIEPLRDRRLEDLSGGERQSAYIAAALAQEANTLILDEPTTHLDPRHQRDIATLLVKLNRERGLSIVVATHDLNFAALLAHRILALRQGAMVAFEPPAQLLRPERLIEVFDAPFTTVRGGDRPVTLLELEP